MRVEQRLLRIVESYMAVYGGRRKLREIEMLLRVQQTTATGLGISPSELARTTTTPRETLRRNLQVEEDAGNLHIALNSEDGRAVLVFATDKGTDSWATWKLIEPLGRLFGRLPVDDPAAMRRLPFDQLITVVDEIKTGYMSDIRIRGARMALLVMEATLRGTSVSITELARRNDAPLETVRRILIQHVEMGHIRFVGDPDDARQSMPTRTGSTIRSR